jgi:large subunit ribosomal protein L13
MNTESIKQKEITRDWHLVDANDKNLGRLASEIAQVLRGKHKPNFSPNMAMGDFVIVINAEKVKLTGNKENVKTYFRHSGFPGGHTFTPIANVRVDHPERIITNAVKGMLPHNRLGRQILKQLKVYSGQDHPHDA